MSEIHAPYLSQKAVLRRQVELPGLANRPFPWVVIASMFR